MHLWLYFNEEMHKCMILMQEIACYQLSTSTYWLTNQKSI